MQNILSKYQEQKQRIEPHVVARDQNQDNIHNEVFEETNVRKPSKEADAPLEWVNEAVKHDSEQKHIVFDHLSKKQLIMSRRW